MIERKIVDGRVHPTAELQHVVILGKGPSRDEPLPLPPDEVWGMNAMSASDRGMQQRATRWFQIHQVGILPPDEMIMLANCPVPIYTMKRERTSVSPNSLPYPLDDVLKWVADTVTGGRDRPTFASSFDFMMALALYEGAIAISLLGIELALGAVRERVCEHPSLAWWIGFAQGRGVRVWWPEASWVLRHPYVYGVDYHEEGAWSLMLSQSVRASTVPIDDGAAVNRSAIHTGEGA